MRRAAITIRKSAEGSTGGARIARVVVPDSPHHVTQRGNRREPVFFEANDYRLYRRLVAAAARRTGAAVWAYCLMPNHVHLPIMPTWRDAADADGLRATFAKAHRRYTGAINARFWWTGHLFQGRFGAVVMDEAHLLAAARYIALNPVVAGLVSRAEDWPWSSTRAQLAGEDDEPVTVASLRALIPDFAAFLAMPTDAATTTRIERASTIGRPLGARNGSQCSSPGSTALGTPQTRPKSREWSGTPRGKLSCSET
jgi:putative transposase